MASANSIMTMTKPPVVAWYSSRHSGHTAVGMLSKTKVVVRTAHSSTAAPNRPYSTSCRRRSQIKMNNRPAALPATTVTSGTVRTKNRRRSKMGCNPSCVPMAISARPLLLGRCADTGRRCSTLSPLRSRLSGSGNSSGRSHRTRR